MDDNERENDKSDVEFTYDNESKLNNFVYMYGGATIGGVIALILCITGIYKFLFCVIIVLFGMFLGNYVQKNKIDVKEKLKNFIDMF